MSAAYDAGAGDEARRLMGEADGLADGPQKIAALEEAVRLADVAGELSLRYDARADLVEAAYFGGAPEKALVAYSWCLAQQDRNPGRFDEWQLLWRYKWMINVIPEFPQIPRGQIEAMLGDMERRFRKGGYGLRSVFQYHYRIARFMGERGRALDYYARARAEPNDALSDCEACRIDEQVSYHVYTGEDELALDTARPLINGRRFCRTVPQRTFSRLLLPLLRLGRGGEAMDYHRRGYRLVKSEACFIEYASEHLVFLSVYGDTAGAASLLEKHYGVLELNRNPYERFTFHRAAWVFFELLADSGAAAVNLRLPESFPPLDSFPLHDSGRRYETSKLRDWFRERAREVAQKFDARNGNDYFTREWMDISELKQLAASLRGRPGAADEVD